MNKGGLVKVRELIYKVMDGEPVDIASLSQQECNYVKTAMVLMGEALYSNAWLES